MAAGTVVEAVAEEVATNLEEVAQATRMVDTKAVTFFGGGISVGVAIGFFFGYRFNKEKLRAEAFKMSENEVAEIREDYHRRAMAIEKAPLEKIIEERGYSVKEVDVVPERPLKPPVPLVEAPRAAHPALPEEAPPARVAYGNVETEPTSDWDYPTELAGRTQEAPYIIHRDEMQEMQNTPGGYNSVTYTYYAEDDVLVDTDDRPIPHPDLVVGEENLRFGHGSDDIHVVFVRNDRLQLDIEICRSLGSFEREVIGLQEDSALEHSERRRYMRRHRSEDEPS